MEGSIVILIIVLTEKRGGKGEGGKEREISEVQTQYSVEQLTT